MGLSNPTPTLTGEWLMTLVNDILKHMPGLGRPQRKFLATLFGTILVLRGRVNFRNLSRYCAYSERTIARVSVQVVKTQPLPSRLSHSAPHKLRPNAFFSGSILASQRPYHRRV